MVLGLLKKGDEVLNVTNEFIAIKRKKGVVDIVPLYKDGENWRVDVENIVTIGYGDNTVTYENEDGVQIINF
jgi:predicted transport protein